MPGNLILTVKNRVIYHAGVFFYTAKMGDWSQRCVPKRLILLSFKWGCYYE